MKFTNSRTKGVLAMAAVLSALAAPLAAQANGGVTVGGGVTVTVNRPGVYGHVVLGGLPPPPVILSRPVIVHQPPPQRVTLGAPVLVASPPPLYIYAPHGHQRKWHKHCHRYDACGRPVYFVQESWIVERHREHEHGHARGHAHGEHGHGGKPPPVYRAAHHDDAHGRGHGRGRGHGHDHGHGHGHGEGRRHHD
jgi:hypothetical protein